MQKVKNDCDHTVIIRSNISSLRLHYHENHSYDPICLKNEEKIAMRRMKSIPCHGVRTAYLVILIHQSRVPSASESSWISMTWLKIRRSQRLSLMGVRRRLNNYYEGSYGETFFLLRRRSVSIEGARAIRVCLLKAPNRAADVCIAQKPSLEYQVRNFGFLSSPLFRSSFGVELKSRGSRLQANNLSIYKDCFKAHLNVKT